MSTKYVELVRQDNVAAFPDPFVFDQTVDTAGWKEISVWVHVFVNNFNLAPITSAAKLRVRFMHVFGHQLGAGGSFDYAAATIPWNSVTSYINGDVHQRLIGDKLRIVCTAENLPPGPYQLFVTCYLT
jgi:hypothetical protein